MSLPLFFTFHTTLGLAVLPSPVKQVMYSENMHGMTTEKHSDSTMPYGILQLKEPEAHRDEKQGCNHTKYNAATKTQLPFSFPIHFQWDPCDPAEPQLHNPSKFPRGIRFGMNSA